MNPVLRKFWKCHLNVTPIIIPIPSHTPGIHTKWLNCNQPNQMCAIFCREITLKLYWLCLTLMEKNLEPYMGSLLALSEKEKGERGGGGGKGRRKWGEGRGKMVMTPPSILITDAQPPFAWLMNWIMLTDILALCIMLWELLGISLVLFLYHLKPSLRRMNLQQVVWYEVSHVLSGGREEGEGWGWVWWCQVWPLTGTHLPSSPPLPQELALPGTAEQLSEPPSLPHYQSAPLSWASLSAPSAHPTWPAVFNSLACHMTSMWHAACVSHAIVQ